MKHILNWIVGNAKPRWTFRIVMGCTMLIFSWIYSSIQDMQIEFRHRIALQTEMWRLESEVSMLEQITSDSILKQSQDSATHRMLSSWYGFAKWSEELRSKAQRKEVDFDWKVGELIPVLGYRKSVMQIPVTMKILPWSKSLESTLDFVESIASDTATAWQLDEVWIQGTRDGMSDTRFEWKGWMLP